MVCLALVPLFFLLSGCLLEPPEFDNPVDPANQPDLTFAGSLYDTEFDFSTTRADVTFFPADEEEFSSLRVLEASHDTGIEFRELEKITGTGTYEVGSEEGQMRMGIWSRPVIEPIYGYNNIPAGSGTVTVVRFDEILAGEYSFYKEDGGDPIVDVSGTFHVRNFLQD